MTKLVSLSKDKIKFLLLEGVDPQAVEVLKKHGYTNIVYYKKALEGQDLLDEIADAHFVGLRSRTQLTAEVIKSAKKLIAIGCFCIGTNQVDLDTAAELGIPVFNAPFSNTRSVAELVLAEAILLMRNIARKNSEVHRGIWNKTPTFSNEVRGKTLGIVGYGHIGSQVSILAEALGMNVIYFDIEAKLPLGNAKPVESLNTLLEQSDVVSLHVPDTASTRNMINASNVNNFKDGGVLINAARGTVVDIDAISTVLENGKLRGAAFDVFPKEPKSAGEEFESVLRKYDNVFLTPHIGGSTAEAQANIGVEVANKFVKYSDNGSTLSSVNFPEVSLPSQPGKTVRLMHIHANKPGVMNEINKVFMANDINIVGQFLNTTPKMGYVVIDVEAEHNVIENLLADLRKIPGTIKARILY